MAYISGYSGSGKSTTALSLAKPGDKVIHLDAYSEPDSGGAATLRNKDFNSYLDRHVPRWKEMANATKTGENGSMKKYSKEYWNTVDLFREAIENFGKEQFSKGHKVIVEGVQIADDWLVADKSYYTGKPIAILGTNPVTSIRRAFERDGRGNLVKGLGSVESAKEYVQWYANTNKRLNIFWQIRQMPNAARNGFAIILHLCWKLIIPEKSHTKNKGGDDKKWR